MSFQSMRLKIISGTTGSAERRFSSWIGGSILASLVSIMCISHFWDRPVPIFTDVRFSYLALVQDKKIMCVLLANAWCTVYVNCPSPILHAFPFYNKQFTVYKFSIFYKHANPNNQPYYYIITFTQYTKIRNYFFDWHEGEITHIVYMIVC